MLAVIYKNIEIPILDDTHKRISYTRGKTPYEDEFDSFLATSKSPTDKIYESSVGANILHEVLHQDFFNVFAEEIWLIVNNDRVASIVTSDITEDNRKEFLLAMHDEGISLPKTISTYRSFTESLEYMFMDFIFQQISEKDFINDLTWYTLIFIFDFALADNKKSPPKYPNTRRWMIYYINPESMDPKTLRKYNIAISNQRLPNASTPGNEEVRFICSRIKSILARTSLISREAYAEMKDNKNYRRYIETVAKACSKEKKSNLFDDRNVKGKHVGI
jgi:hypothetical protein